MNKLIFALAIFSMVSFGVVANSHASSMTQNGMTIYDGTKLVGAMVRARDGVELGRIFDLVITSHGNVAFAIISQVTPPDLTDPWPGHIVAVPFGALKISKGESQKIQVVFNGDKEKFYEAPDFYGNKDLANLQKVTEEDRYFGVQPSWTEGGHTAVGQTAEDWMLVRLLDARRWDHWGERWPQNSEDL